jgi:thiamine transport system ATP-binding protein
VLTVDDVTVRFGERVVLDSVDLHVAVGQIVALLGPSGSGKSTLLRVIAGIVPADAGRVVLDGVDITSRPTHRRSVGMVFQNEQLFPHMDVAGNVGFGLRMAGFDKRVRGQRVTELLELVGLAGFGSRHIDGLSGGERKRVALARSLAPRPKLLLLDEPLTGLDRELHDRLAAEVSAILEAQATTAIWVTHDAEEAATVAGRTVALAAI